MRKHIILIIFFFFIQNAFSIYFRNIGMKDGLSQLSVMSIHQDELGRMWFGTLEGLNMYDGDHITIFKPTETNLPGSSQIIGNDNRYITGDGKGFLYFRSHTALIKYEIKKQKFSTLIAEGISAVNYTGNRLYFGKADSVFYWDQEQATAEFLFRIEEENPQMQKILTDSRGNTWVGTRRNLYVKEPGQTVKAIIQEEDIFDVYEDSRNIIWIATYAGGVYYKEEGDSFIQLSHDPDDPNSLSSNQTRCFTEDNYGNIWIGTFTGLNKYNPATRQFTYYGSDLLPGTLTHTSIFSLFKDVQGSIWIGTYYGGVHYINPETDLFTFYAQDKRRKDCLSAPFVGHMVEDKNNNLWICTEGGGLNFFDRKTKQFTHITADGSSNTIPHNNLKGICYNSKYEKLYIGTHTGGLSIYDIRQNRFRNLSTKDHPVYPEEAGDVVNKVDLYKDEYLVFMTQLGIYKMDLITEQISPLFKNPPFYAGNDFLIDSKGYIWLARQRNVLRINLQDESDQKEFRCGENG